MEGGSVGGAKKERGDGRKRQTSAEQRLSDIKAMAKKSRVGGGICAVWRPRWWGSVVKEFGKRWMIVEIV